MSVRLPRQGDSIIYRPRVAYGRQSELTALITRVWNAEKGDIDIVAFPAEGEAMRLQHVIQQSETVQIHCWAFVPDDRIAQLEEMVQALRDGDGGKVGKQARRREPDLVGG